MENVCIKQKNAHAGAKADTAQQTQMTGIVTVLHRMLTAMIQTPRTKTGETLTQTVMAEMTV